MVYNMKLTVFKVKYDLNKCSILEFKIIISKPRIDLIPTTSLSHNII